MNLKFILLCTFALLPSVAEAQKPLARLTQTGAVVHNTHGLAKWRTKRDVNNNGDPGDTFILTVRPLKSEKVTVGVYLYATPLKKVDYNYVTAGPERKVPVSAIGREWGHLSTSLQSAGAWCMIDNSQQQQTDMTVQVFVPYAIIGLPNGPYRLRYRIRVLDRASGKELDSFFAKLSYDVMVRPGAYREIRSTVSSGPQIKTFEFDGAAKPKNPA